MDMHTDYYQTAVRSLTESVKQLGPESQSQQQNPVLHYMAHGLLLMAQGLLAESQKTDSRLAEIARRLPPAK